AAQSPVATLYRQAAMQRHNVHRANHGAGPVTWSAKLERAAMKSAQRCTFGHFMNENGLTYGQNLALGLPANKIAAIISDQWYYNEVGAFSGNYGDAQPDYGSDMQDFEKWGHFTQLVWKDSVKIGCATWRCNSIATSEDDATPLPSSYGGDITYCNYKSEGNFAGEYAANVGAPRSNVKVKANS
ncbi:PR-1-like protein, partial [Myriangium duriaei CBS 260.36]